MKKLDISSIKCIYFLGIGGIGMSALARYFNSQGFQVKGYDKTPSPLTETLIEEGIEISYIDKADEVGKSFLNKDEVLVVITPAVAASTAAFSERIFV